MFCIRHNAMNSIHDDICTCSSKEFCVCIHSVKLFFNAYPFYPLIFLSSLSSYSFSLTHFFVLAKQVVSRFLPIKFYKNRLTAFKIFLLIDKQTNLSTNQTINKLKTLLFKLLIINKNN